ncbi:thiamine-phosphate kinase [Pigmentiphaga litoralis]|uniref:Thiamine-monophosphate kinase n=1 Tax=Pigmentiphaga litoralis TaxID=516702 RepID=A0A7Y9LNR2_9BURK|nr:thiamine-phosphate kinase [Pigmentiphaga litoralis]NYE25827.1 thiamine-monophosphate kinase [Pigmentiphaga litoralis]NYE84947.1 thiamine-monophosphate kinase [Pigmentiphaga litoralis]
MADGEFDLIRRHFSRPAPPGVLGVGDDCALLPTQPGAMAISTDLLVEGRHFFSDVDPAALGHKSLAVNLSDLAAMGAQPAGFVLGLALPRIDHDFLAGFARGMYALADRHACPLIGGDTTRGQDGIVISITIFGTVAPDDALRRDGARPDDDIWVSGCLGDADIALRLLLGEDAFPPGADRSALLAATRRALEWPEPRLALGQGLRGVACAALDISDGLLQDLGHVLTASGVGARVDADAVPVSPAVAALPVPLRRLAALSGGDVYELCFTAAPGSRARVIAAAAAAGVPVTRIGQITAAPGLRLVDASGDPIDPLPHGGYDHFA